MEKKVFAIRISRAGVSFFLIMLKVKILRLDLGSYWRKGKRNDDEKAMEAFRRGYFKSHIEYKHIL